MKKYILLVRHAESLNNASGNKFSGIVDSPITEKGLDYSRKLAGNLSRFKVETVLTSSLERAKETAELVFPNIPIRICEELMEFNYGEYDGVSPDDLPHDQVFSSPIKTEVNKQTNTSVIIFFNHSIIFQPQIAPCYSRIYSLTSS